MLHLSFLWLEVLIERRAVLSISAAVAALISIAI